MLPQAAPSAAVHRTVPGNSFAASVSKYALIGGRMLSFAWATGANPAQLGITMYLLVAQRMLPIGFLAIGRILERFWTGQNETKRV